MSELRQDPFTDHWVAIAPNRDARPREFSQTVARRDERACPFCQGNESETPNAVAEYAGSNEAGDWIVRVVPNKYPAVEPAAGDAADAASDLPVGLGQIQPGIGVHEVIVESPVHVVSFSQVTEVQAEWSFRAYRDRLLALQTNSDVAYGLIFKNTGDGAGASLEHVHSQLIALPWIPPVVQYELTKAHEFAQLRGTSLMQAVLAEELADSRRVVAVTERFIAFCPLASRFPYETWVVPRRPEPRYELESPDVLDEAARLVRDVIVRLERVLDRPAYNYWVHSAPLHDDSGRIHWRLEIAPRLARVAGFEIGSGCFINPVAPEVAATRLR